jgi:polyhydroxybutyrate depolymerase
VQYGNLTVDGVVRSYRVFAPPTSGPRPRSALIVVLHGGAATISDAVSTTGFDQVATDHNLIVAYPQGTHGEWNAGFCCGTAPSRMVDDIGFLDALLDRLEADYPVDPTRVFLTGVSNGAMMAYRFACTHAQRVTAVASVAGSMVLNDCTPSRPLSILELHGTADPEVPYQGGEADIGVLATFQYPSSPALAARWATLDGCASQPATTMVGPLTTATWGDCHAGTTVSLVSVNGGGHVWFAPGLGTADGAIDATAAIWRFFSTLHSMP